ncbi:hypothetical protein HDV00_002026 [Rhizophlyctis rosea]|nr:hypothetical protein HDV00_002026 [Rhizophlyctis rosea]
MGGKYIRNRLFGINITSNDPSVRRLSVVKILDFGQIVPSSLVAKGTPTTNGTITVIEHDLYGGSYTYSAIQYSLTDGTRLWSLNLRDAIYPAPLKDRYFQPHCLQTLVGSTDKHTYIAIPTRHGRYIIDYDDEYWQDTQGYITLIKVDPVTGRRVGLPRHYLEFERAEERPYWWLNPVDWEYKSMIVLPPSSSTASSDRIILAGSQIREGDKPVNKTRLLYITVPHDDFTALKFEVEIRPLGMEVTVPDGQGYGMKVWDVGPV